MEYPLVTALCSYIPLNLSYETVIAVESFLNFLI